MTNKRVIAKSGFISRNTIETNLNRVGGITIEQSVLGRIFNYGSLVISGSGAKDAPIRGISDPMKFRRAFLEAQDKANG